MPASGRIPVPGSYLLDTSVVVSLLNGDPATANGLESASAVFVSSIALGELDYGAGRSGRPTANLSRIDDFADSCAVLAAGRDTAREYGRVKSELRSKGRPIPENDVWIAACALHHGLILVTRDRHFEEVDGLVTEPW